MVEVFRVYSMLVDGANVVASCGAGHFIDVGVQSAAGERLRAEFLREKRARESFGVSRKVEELHGEELDANIRYLFREVCINYRSGDITGKKSYHFDPRTLVSNVGPHCVFSGGSMHFQ